MSSPKDIKGQKFGRLTVVCDSGRRSHDRCVIWECCCDCGNITFVRSDSLVRGHTKSCGCLKIECTAGKNNPMYGRTGENSPNWKGGVSSENQIIRHSSDYKEWRTAVFKRDDHTCQKCKKRGGTLNAHHIEGYNFNPELRTEISNGITLCKDCHQNFHRQYGRGDNTRDQLELFIKENK